MQKHWLH